jgi:hypothetical protein
VLGVVDEDLEHEAVDLRLGQRVGALRLDRVLGRHHEERVGHRVRRVAERHLALLHHLEQRRLHLRGGAVDLVRQQEVAEDRPELGVERRAVRAVDARADQVGGDEVGGELDALEGTAEDVGGRLHRQRLGETGHALDQQMPAGQEADEHTLEHLILPGDDPADLEERLLEPNLRGCRVRGFDATRHVHSPSLAEARVRGMARARAAGAGRSFG